MCSDEPFNAAEAYSTAMRCQLCVCACFPIDLSIFYFNSFWKMVDLKRQEQAQVIWCCDQTQGWACVFLLHHPWAHPSTDQLKQSKSDEME